MNIPSGSLWQTNITMENHHVQNENQRYMTWPFSIAMSNFQWACVSEVMVPKGIPKSPWVSLLKLLNDLDDLGYHGLGFPPYDLDFLDHTGV